MNHPIPDTNDSHSCQVILPQKQLGRKSDMYVALNFTSWLLFITPLENLKPTQKC